MKKLLLLIFTLCVGQITVAQNLQHTVQGILQDSIKNIPLEFATVALLQNSQVIKAGYSNEKGVFRFEAISTGDYTLRITAVGYKNYEKKLSFSESPQIETYFLQPSTSTLAEVKVVATKPLIIQEADRLSYDLDADPESKAMNVLDMMRKIPYLSLDADDNLSLKNSFDFRIFINGRPSAMLMRNYKDVLKTMPASSIKRIEVITTPPSKYDGEGLSGIINIITHKQLDSGYMGNINTSHRFPIGGPNLGGTLTAKRGKWGLSTFAGGSKYYNPLYSYTNERNSIRQNPNSLIQTGRQKSNSTSGYLGTELSFEIDTLNLLTAQFNYNGNKNFSNKRQSSDLTSNSEIIQAYKLLDEGQANGSGMDAGINYQKNSKADKSRMLTFSYLYSKSNNMALNNISFTERIGYNLLDYRQENEQTTRENTAQIDYVYPFKKLVVESGIKTILRNNTSAFLQGNETENNFTNSQNIYGAYGSFRYSSAKWSISGGFRLERTTLNADFESANQQVHQAYNNLLPTLSFNRKMGKNSLGLSYLERIQRPGIYQLNPFIDRSNPNIERTGNPDLHPSVMQDLSIKYSYSGKTFVHVSVGYLNIKDMLFPVILYDAVTNISRHSYDNVGKAQLLPVIIVSLNRQFKGVWNASLNGQWTKGTVKGIVNGEEIVNSGTMYGTHGNVGFRSPKGWRWNVNAGYNGPSVNIQETRLGYFHSSLSVNKDVVKNKLSVSMIISNPFSKYRKNITEGFGPDFTQYYEQQNYFRSAQVSLNYKFGEMKGSVRKNQRGIRNDDVKK